MGVKGPAYGGLIAVVFFNLIRFLAIWKIYHLQPFSWANLKALGTAAVCAAVAYIIPSTGNIYLDILIPSAVFTLSYGLMILRTRLSPDINHVAEAALKRFSR